MFKFLGAAAAAIALAWSGVASAAVVLPTQPHHRGIKLSALAYDGQEVEFVGGPYASDTVFTISTWLRQATITTLDIKGLTNQTVYAEGLDRVSGSLILGHTDDSGLFSLASPLEVNLYGIIRVGDPTRNYGARFQVLGFGAEGIGARVPEPSTWALLIAGFGMAGSALRRRRLQAA